MPQDTVPRTRDIEVMASPWIACNEEQSFIVAEQMGRIGVEPAAIILEPFGRNKAPAVAVAGLEVIGNGGNPQREVAP